MIESQRAVLEGIDNLRQAFDTKIKYDESKERVIDRLHEEVQQHRRGMVSSILQPLLIDLVGLYNDIDKLTLAPVAGDDPEAALAIMVRNLAAFEVIVEDILSRNGVTKYEADDDRFDGKRQRAIRTIPTPYPNHDRRVVERLRKGFIYEDQVLQPEMVVVSTYVPDDEPGQPVDVMGGEQPTTSMDSAVAIEQR